VKCSKATLRSAVGWLGIGFVAAGFWGLFGWPAAALVAGTPIAAFYLYSQARILTRGSE
jgi:hypothetical protein